MTHLSERTSKLLSVKMYCNSFYHQSFIKPLIFCNTFITAFTEKIDHHRRGFNCRGTQWQIHKRPKVLFKLRSDIRLYGMMPAVMNAGSDFVDKNFPVFSQKHFYCQQSNNLERFSNVPCNLLSPFFNLP